MDFTGLRQIAAQLSHPEGEDGIRTGQEMHTNNGEMTRRAIDLLQCCDEEHILEIGQGSGAHVPYLLAKATALFYEGIDISETMTVLAGELNAAEVQAGRVRFVQGEGLLLPWPDNTFDRVFTVNTLYFWADPQAQLAGIQRVLKPGGSFLLAFRSRNFMEKLPFTGFGEFRLYNMEDGIELLEKNGFRVQERIYEKEETFSILQETLEKDRVLLRAVKI
ncbi:MAG: class I SAM-dependent methyltransferase [Bacteroidia bacterium]|nr:class I SAM-dependent methyltransferase [Bacteroidia bacterium]